MTFPSTLSTFNRPTASDRLDSPSHSALHNTVSSAVGQIEAVIGVEGDSSVVGTLEYLIKSPASDGGGHVQTAIRGGTGQTAFMKGDILVGQSSSVLTKLAVGGAGQNLIVNDTAPLGVSWGSVAGLPSSVLTVIPKSPLNNLNRVKKIATNSVMTVGQVVVPLPITVNYLTVLTGNAIASAGTADFTLYKENGSASMFSVTTPTISAANTLYTTNVSSVLLSPGNYYAAVNTNSTADIELAYWTNTDFFTTSILSFGNLPGEPVLEGTYVIPAGAPPSSIVTTGITSFIGGGINTPVFRLDT